MALSPQQLEEAKKYARQKLNSGRTAATSSGGGSKKISDERIAQLKAIASGQTMETERESKNTLPIATQVGTGVAKGAISTLTGAAGLGERMLGSFWKTVLPKSLEKKLGITENTPTLGIFKKPTKEVKTSAEELIPEKARKPEGTAEKAGFIGEQIAEFFIPGGAGLKVGKAVEKVAGASKLAKALKLGATALTEGGLAGGQTAIQKGKVDDETIKAAKYGAAVPVVGSALGKLLKGAGKVGTGILGLTTGAKSGAIEEAFNNPNVIKYAREAGKSAEALQDDILNQVKEGYSKIKQSRALEYQSKLEKIKLNNTQLDDITRGVRDEARKLIEDFDIKVIPQDKTGSKLNMLDFSSSTLLRGKDVAEKAMNDVMSWTDNSAIGLDKLKQRLGTYLDQLSPINEGQARLFVSKLKDSITQGLKKNVSGYAEMTQGYAKASALLDDINATFSLGSKNKETAIKKILSSLRENNEQRKELLSALGGDEILAKVAGSQLGQLTPRGIAGVLAPTASSVGGLAALGNPAIIPGLLAYAATSSPRLMAEFVSILGKIDRAALKSGNLPIQIQRALREWIIKAQKE